MSRKRQNSRKNDGSYKTISPSARTDNQKAYIKSINTNDIVLCDGPAGSGKTFLAVGQAMYYLKTNQVKRVVVTRPAVEAGESTGFLPGDIENKLGPYIRPIDDVMRFFCPGGDDEIKCYKENHQLEICPIGYMRGMTHEDAFVVCDEAQNLTEPQIKMLLTRLGENSKLVLNGDFTQSDLNFRDQGAFKYVCHIFKELDGVGIIRLTKDDIQRHRLVSKLLEIYENNIDRFSEIVKID